MNHMKHKVEWLFTRLEDAYKIINHQQKFLVALDAGNRGENIVTGVAEEENAMEVGDVAKVRAVIEAAGVTGCDTTAWKMERLGHPDMRKKRPIRLKMKNQEENKIWVIS